MKRTITITTKEEKEIMMSSLMDETDSVDEDLKSQTETETEHIEMASKDSDQSNQQQQEDESKEDESKEEEDKKLRAMSPLQQHKKDDNDKNDDNDIHDNDTDNDEKEEEEEEEEEDQEEKQEIDAIVLQEPKHDPTLRVGDHVYKLVSFAGVPGMVQHHGLILSTQNDEVVILDFTALLKKDSGSFHKLAKIQYSRNGLCLNRANEDSQRYSWRKVVYEAKYTVFSSPGTSTCVKSDPPGLVMSRAQFLQTHHELLPKYHFLKANSECLAVWCKTGVWATLQASSLLHLSAASQAKSATTLAMLAYSVQVSVPSSGVWGWMGFTTKASLLSAYPYLIPALAGYGVLTIGGPVWVLSRCKIFWHKTTIRLTDDFWQAAIDQPDLFVECITEWSDITDK